MKNYIPVAVTSRSFSRHPVLRAELVDRYADVRFNEDGARLQGSDLIQFLRGRRRAIVALERIDASVLNDLPDLEVLSKYGVGLDAIDLDALDRRGIRLGWTPGVNRRAVAELVIAFAIALLRGIPEAGELVRGGGWHQIAGRELSACTFGVVGCGNIGKEVAMLCRAFGCRVIANDIRDYAAFYVQNNVEPVGLNVLLERSDIVSLHVPLDNSTRNILCAERLALMKTGACLINTARGSLVDEVALKALLIEGRLGGAAFDVFSTEPPEDQELIQLRNFIVTPHIGGSTDEAILAMGRAAIAGLDKARDISYVRRVIQGLAS